MAHLEIPTRSKSASSAGGAGKPVKPATRPASKKPGGLASSRPSAPRKRWVTVLKWSALGVLVLTALMAVFVATVFWYYSRDLPDVSKLKNYHPAQVTAIQDKDGHRIGEVFTERRTVVAYAKIPPILVDALIATEDEHFRTHGGIDYVGMVRAFFANARAGKAKQGASTITQQVVKNLVLGPQKTFKRKIQEVLLARRLEHTLTKDEILALYLNQVNFGDGRYGVQEAARYYFGKDIENVNVGEAALLAGLPQSPQRLSPRNPANQQRAKERQTHVLHRLVEVGKLSAEEAQKWIDAPIQIVKTPYADFGVAPEWVDQVKQALAAHAKAKPDDFVESVRTTVDPRMQRVAQQALRAGLRAVDARQKVGVKVRSVKPAAIDAELDKLKKKRGKAAVEQGKVYQAIVTAVHDTPASLDVDLGDWPADLPLAVDDDRYGLDKDGEAKQPSARFAVGDVVQVVVEANGEAKPKKTPKPAPATGSAGAVPEDDADDPGDDDAPPARQVALAGGPEGAVVIIEVATRKVRAMVGGYASKAGGFNRATMSHRQAGSSFKPFVYATAIDEGKATAAEIVNDAPEQFDLWKPKNYETSKYEGPVRLRYALAKSINTVAIRVCYEAGPTNVAALARKMGIQSELPTEMSMALGSGSVTPLEMTNAFATFAAGGMAAAPQLLEAIGDAKVAGDAPVLALRPEVAFVLVDMMRSVIEEGTAAVVKKLGLIVAGKTGTSNDARDAWFIGMTPDYVIGVWVGYDDNHPMGSSETGGHTAAPIFAEIAKSLGLPKKAFARPAHVVDARIDKATGLLAPEGAAAGTTYTEVFVEGTAPTEVAPLAGEVTGQTVVTDEYGD